MSTSRAPGNSSGWYTSRRSSSLDARGMTVRSGLRSTRCRRGQSVARASTSSDAVAMAVVVTSAVAADGDHHHHHRRVEPLPPPPPPPPPPTPTLAATSMAAASSKQQQCPSRFGFEPALRRNERARSREGERATKTRVISRKKVEVS